MVKIFIRWRLSSLTSMFAKRQISTSHMLGLRRNAAKEPSHMQHGKNKRGKSPNLIRHKVKVTHDVSVQKKGQRGARQAERKKREKLLSNLTVPCGGKNLTP